MNLININQEGFHQIYQLMEESFPVSERRNYKEAERLCENPLYYIDVVKNEENKIQGFVAYWKLSKVVFVEHLAVSSSARGKNIGSTMMKKFMKAQNKPIILEVEKPLDEMSERRIVFYERLGFKQNKVGYFQPDLQKGAPKIFLHIMSYGAEFTEESFEFIKKELFSTVYNQN
jgi:ribosomal protein S18 acetylase RimI-like enzyme